MGLRRKKDESERFAYAYGWANARAESGWWHSFELPDGSRIHGVNSIESLGERLSCFPIPGDLNGKRVLDIGTWDGWFAFEMEKRGAMVVALDSWDNPRFREIHERLNSRVEYTIMDVYDVSPESIGQFDIVLFMGVLYHLKHPLLALEKVCAITTEYAAVSSFILQEQYLPGCQVEKRSLLEFYETTEFGGQTDNWFAPSLPCLTALCRTAGFARVNIEAVTEYGASLSCYRKWLSPTQGQPGTTQLSYAVHARNGGVSFRSSRDEYVGAVFESPREQLARGEVFPEVGSYGVAPICVTPLQPGIWQANFKLPPGLCPGWHDARVRIGSELPGNSVRIAVDLPLDQKPSITGICDGSTWMPNQIQVSLGRVLCVWADGLPENADRNTVTLTFQEASIPPLFIEPLKGPEPRQLNFELPGNLRFEPTPVALCVGQYSSDPVTIHVLE